MNENQVQYTPVICQHCDKDTGLKQENLMFLVVFHDIRCPHCDKIVVIASGTII